MTGDEYTISSVPPRDEEGHPIHPERGHRICGAVKSDKTTPTEHGRERDDVEYCLLAAGWGTDSNVGACRKHPYSGSQLGASNPNYEHGAYSEHLRSQLTEQESEAYEDLVKALQDPTEALGAIRELAAEVAIKYQRTGDDRFLREFRQLADTFNMAPNEDVTALTDGTDYWTDSASKDGDSS
jgi:hypothetical protein